MGCIKRALCVPEAGFLDRNHICFILESTTVRQRCIAGTVPAFLCEERDGEVICGEIQHGHISLCKKKYK